MTHFKSLKHYVDTVGSLWLSREGKLVADYLSFRDIHVANGKLQVQHLEPSLVQALKPPFDEMVAAHLRAIYAVHNQDYIEAYCCQTLLIQYFTKTFQAQRDQNWALPILNALCIDLRVLAARADKVLSSRGTGRPLELIEKAAECLMGCFRVCAADNRCPEEFSKRWGMLALVNQLFKVYFQINTLPLCKPLIRAIEALPFKNQFDLSQQITYKYYVGRKAMYDNDYKSANNCLTFAFERCHKKSVRNKRLTLIHLIPVRMLLGYLPKKKVLEKYDLLQFWEVAEALKLGNILQLNNVLNRHAPFFIKFGIYLTLEHLKSICMRNLFKRVHDVLKVHIVPIRALLLALKMMEMTDVDLDETQCILANLICEGKIKGYISYNHQVLVVSKQNAFPPLSSLP